MRFELFTTTTLKITAVWNTNLNRGEIKEIKHKGRMKNKKKEATEDRW